MFAIDPVDCTECGVCKDACPCDAIYQDEKGHFIVYS